MGRGAETVVRDSRGAVGLRISMHIAHTNTAATVNLSEPLRTIALPPAASEGVRTAGFLELLWDELILKV